MPTIGEKILGGICVGLLAVICSGLVIHSCETNIEQAKIVALENQVASTAKTIEISKGVYETEVMQEKSLREMLDYKSAEVSALYKTIDKNKQDLLTSQQLVVQWKKAYEGLASATETHVDPSKGQPATAGREKVDFHEDFGAIKVDGWTLTNPPQAWVRLTQGRPLKLTLAITQDKDKAWHAYATSSEENMQIDIALATVNPYVLQPKWYEHIGVALDLGAGTNSSGLGALVGLGVNYQFLQFTLGPHVWLGLNNSVDKYYGVSFEWRPFQRK